MFERLANEVLSSIEDILGNSCDVFIVNDQNVVIATTDSSQAGNVFDESILMKGASPFQKLAICNVSGVNMGSVIIYGAQNAEKESLIAHFIKQEIELLLEHQLLPSNLSHEHALQNLIFDMVTYDANVDDDGLFALRAKALHFSLEAFYIPIAIDLYHFREYAESYIKKNKKQLQNEIDLQNLKQLLLVKIRSVFNNKNDCVSYVDSSKYIVFYAVPQRMLDDEFMLNRVLQNNCKKVLDIFKKKGIYATIGVGTVAQGIIGLTKAYKNAWKALLLGKQINKTPGIYNIQKFSLDEIFASIPQELAQQYIDLQFGKLLSAHNYEVLIDTIFTWNENLLNRCKTAEKLHIHRNTLKCRFDKIKKLTRKDMNLSIDSIELYIACRLFSLSPPPPPPNL